MKDAVQNLLPKQCSKKFLLCISPPRKVVDALEVSKTRLDGALSNQI